MNEQQEKTYAWIRDAAAQIPEKASVGTTNKLGAHVSNRMGAFFYPEKNHTDYVFIDESELKGQRPREAQPRGQAGRARSDLRRHDRMALFRRNHDKTPPPAASASTAPPPQHETDPQRDHEKEE